MSKLTTLSILMLSAATLPAQRPGGGPGGGTRPNTITTTSDFGSLADVGGNSDFNSIATGTAARRGLRIGASVGGTRLNMDRASASSSVSFSASRTLGAGARISEFGAVRNGDSNQSASAGTSGDAPGAASPTQGAHSVEVAYPNIASGNTAIVTIFWHGSATSGASASADVDVDGDGTPDFSGVADGNRASATLQVTAGASGVVLDITTNGSAAVAADGNERYSATLSVFVREGALPTSCTFTNFGTACGADLNGSVGTNLDLDLDVTNATADAFGIIVVGDQLATPMPLPVGTCDLLIDARFGRRGFNIGFRTDAAGSANVSLRTPRSAITTSFQAIVFSRDPVMMTRNLDASNGTELVCQ